jgi:hypothetical protein
VYDLLDELGTWTIAIGLSFVSLGVSEIAAYFGRKSRSTLDETARTNLNTIEAAMLALIGLLLAFSLNLALAHYDARRHLLVDEVNAIGTAWLRSGICPEPTRTELRSKLRDYTESRAVLFERARYSQIPASEKGDDLRDAIWNEAVTLAKSDDRSIQTGLLIDSLNAMIDMHTRRDDANVHQVPALVWWLLIVDTILAMGTVGFNDGQGSRQNLPARVALTIALSATLALTLDLDRPRRGLIQVSQEPMRALYESMRYAR